MMINIDDAVTKQLVKLIESGDISNVITYVKEQDFWDNPNNIHQELLKEKLETRLKSENLSMDNIHTT